MGDESERTKSDALTFFCRHFVALTLVVKLPTGAQEAEAFSCFVIEVRGRWFLVTAGHSVKKLYETVLPKCEILECNLYDAWHENAEPTPIPFSLKDTEHFALDDGGIDVGFFVLSENQRQLLVAIVGLRRGAHAAGRSRSNRHWRSATS